LRKELKEERRHMGRFKRDVQQIKETEVNNKLDSRVVKEKMEA
jgi:hypothetical protein